MKHFQNRFGEWRKTEERQRETSGLALLEEKKSLFFFSPPKSTTASLPLLPQSVAELQEGRPVARRGRGELVAGSVGLLSFVFFVGF